jgi:hypothetical protein
MAKLRQQRPSPRFHAGPDRCRAGRSNPGKPAPQLLDFEAIFAAIRRTLAAHEIHRRDQAAVHRSVARNIFPSKPRSVLRPASAAWHHEAIALLLGSQLRPRQAIV